MPNSEKPHIVKQTTPRLGIGYEAVKVQYQDKDRTVTFASKRYGLWGIGKVLAIQKIVGPVAKALVNLITKVLFPFSDSR